jgi:hypothetical protein
VAETNEPKAKPSTVYLTDVQKERVKAIEAKRGTDNFTRTVAWLIDDEWRRVENHATKEDAIVRIEAALKHLDNKLSMVLFALWAQNGDRVIALTADDIQRFKSAYAELMAELAK